MSPLLRPRDKVILAGLIALAFWIYWRGAVYIPPDRQAQLGAACIKWMETEIVPGYRARIIESWRKSGHIVFRIGVSEAGSSTGQVFLCVVDPATGDMLKPGAFAAGEWR